MTVAPRCHRAGSPHAGWPGIVAPASPAAPPAL